MAEPAEPDASGPSLWDLEKQWRGWPADMPMPTSLAARRAQKVDDGLTHCSTCGGVSFTGAIVFRTDGQPAQILSPQRCIGCGELRKTNWPS